MNVNDDSMKGMAASAERVVKILIQELSSVEHKKFENPREEKRWWSKLVTSMAALIKLEEEVNELVAPAKDGEKA